MSRLTSRGTSKSDLYTADEAEDFMARSKGPHTLRWLANAYRWTSGGEIVRLMEDIPIVGGTLSMDSSDPIRRHLTLEVGGANKLEPRKYTDPLVPFGQFIILWCTIDNQDGDFFPWMKMGEFHIVSYVFERPSEIATVEAVDYSGIVDEYLHTHKKSYGNRSLATAINQMVRPALPNSAYANVFHHSAYDRSRRVKTWVSDSGTSRWEEAVALAEAKAFDLFFDWSGDLVLRQNLGDGFDDIPPETGPDVGTKSNPIMTIRDEEGGTLIGLTATVTREGAANGVFVNIHETADQKLKKKPSRKELAAYKKLVGDKRVNVQVHSVSGTGSPVKYGDRFGRIPLVFERNVDKITDDVVDHYQDYARTKLSRRRGLVRYLDFQMVGGYWLEPDDKVHLSFGGSPENSQREEDHYVQSISWDLKGGPTTVKTRSLNVVDPGA